MPLTLSEERRKSEIRITISWAKLHSFIRNLLVYCDILVYNKVYI
jgi:hypothetical protein